MDFSSTFEYKEIFEDLSPEVNQVINWKEMQTCT